MGNHSLQFGPLELPSCAKLYNGQLSPPILVHQTIFIMQNQELNPILGNSQFEAEVLQAKEDYIIVDFWAEWCGPCRMIHPTLEKLSQEMAGKLKVVQVNVDMPENQQLSAEFQIMSIPNMLFYGTTSSGQKQLANRKIGAMPELAYRDWLQQEMMRWEEMHPRAATASADTPASAPIENLPMQQEAATESSDSSQAMS